MTILIFFYQVQRGGGPQDTSNEFWKISEIAFNCFKRSKNCWKPFLWSKKCLSTRKNLYKNFNFFSSSAKGGPQYITNEFCKISEIVLNCFKRSKNCWKPFLLLKQCLSTHKSWVWQFQFFLSSARGDHRISPTRFAKGDHTIPPTNFFQNFRICIQLLQTF